jgi:spore coat protein U-like protein
MRNTPAALAATIGFLLCGPVIAGSKTAQMTLAASVTNTCSVGATNVTFPTYVPGGGAVKATSTITVRCTKGDQYGVGLSVGSTTGATFAQRLLANGSNTLQYNLYTSSSDATVWGDGSGATQIESGSAGGFTAPIALTVYALLPDSASNQLAPTGTYTDTVLVVMTF